MIAIRRTDSRGRSVTLLSSMALSLVPQDFIDPGVLNYHVDEVRNGTHYLQKRPGDPMIMTPASIHRAFGNLIAQH